MHHRKQGLRLGEAMTRVPQERQVWEWQEERTHPKK